MLSESANFFISFNSFDGENRTKLSGNLSYSLIWFKKGEGKYVLDFREFKLKESTVLLISQNQQASFHFSSSSFEFVSISFDSSFAQSSNEEIRKLLSFCIREHFEGKQVLSVPEKDIYYLEILFQQLHFINSEWQGELKTNSLYHFLHLVLSYCLQLSKVQEVREPEGYTEIISNFTTLLENNFRITQKVNFYTDNLNLTYNSLSRYTLNYCNKTPKDIIVERLVLEIKRLLSSTNTPIKEIAFKLGFDEPTNLVKYFKKYTGSTPTEFRSMSKNYHSL